MQFHPEKSQKNGLMLLKTFQNLMSVKKRIIPLLTVVDNVLIVKSIKFEKLINVGDPVNSAKIFNDSDADELILLNINRENRELNKFLKLLENISKIVLCHCQ